MATQPRGQAFAAIIRTARAQRGMTQDELVEKSGVSRSTIARWERGDATNPKPDELRAVCAVLGVSPVDAATALGYLQPGDTNPTPPPPDPTVDEVVAILRDPNIPPEAIEHWVGVLRHLSNQPDARRRRSA